MVQIREDAGQKHNQQTGNEYYENMEVEVNNGIYREGIHGDHLIKNFQ